MVMRTVAAELRRAGQGPSHFFPLAMLAHRAVKLSELAEQHAVSLPSMSNTISRLAGMRRQAEARVAEWLAPLSQSDRETLVAGLAVLWAVFGASVPTDEASPHPEKH